MSRTAIGRGHEQIGVMACIVCERELPAKKTATGKLSICCSWCDASIYIDPGTKAFDLVMKRVTVSQAPAADPPAPPASSSAAAPEEKKPARFTGPLFGSRE